MDEGTVYSQEDGGATIAAAQPPQAAGGHTAQIGDEGKTPPSRFARSVSRLHSLRRQFAASPYAATTSKLMTWFVLVAVIVTVAVKLTQIGWGTIWSALPVHFSFYLLTTLGYLALPVADARIYRLVWPQLQWRDILPVSLRKRVLNEGIMGYTGEVYLCFWLNSRYGIGGREAFLVVKDSNILSALVSTVLALVFFGALVATGELGNIAAIATHPAWQIGILTGLLLVVGVLVLNFRLKLSTLTRGQIGRILGLHIVRSLIANVLLLAAWVAALPEIPILTWLTILTAQMLANRFPFLPNQQLVLLGLGVGLASTLHVPSGQLAALYLAYGAVTMGLHGLVYLGTQMLGRRVTGEEKTSSS